MHAYRQKRSCFFWQYRIGHGSSNVFSLHRPSSPPGFPYTCHEAMGVRKALTREAGEFSEKPKFSENDRNYRSKYLMRWPWVTVMWTKRRLSCVTKTSNDTLDGEPGWKSCIVYVVIFCATVVVWCRYDCSKNMYLFQMNFVKKLIFFRIKTFKPNTVHAN